MGAESAQARVHIVNRALLKLGQPASYSIDDQTQLGGLAAQLWQAVEARAVALYDWSHCRRTVKLTALAAGTFDNGWPYGFALPGGRIGEPVAILDQAGASERYCRQFMIEEGNVYARVDTLWARCRFAMDPSFWDLGFAEAFATALAGDLAIPLLQQDDVADYYTRLAWGSPQENYRGGLFGALIALNKAAQPQGRGFLDNDPLTAARRM